MFYMLIFTDADWAGDISTRRSTIGYIEFAVGGPLLWLSMLQTTVSTSSMQSEYRALYAVMQEIVWLRVLLSKLQLCMSKPTPFFLDSQSAEDLAVSLAYHKRSSIEIKYHWVREHEDPDGKIETAWLIHVRTGYRTADIFTKALTGVIFEKHRSRSLGERRMASTEVAKDNKCKQLR